MRLFPALVSLAASYLIMLISAWLVLPMRLFLAIVGFFLSFSILVWFIVPVIELPMRVGSLFLISNLTSLGMRSDVATNVVAIPHGFLVGAIEFAPAFIFCLLWRQTLRNPWVYDWERMQRKPWIYDLRRLHDTSSHIWSWR
jgi:hypothetical protein